MKGNSFDGVSINCDKLLPSRLCLEESKVFRFFTVIFSHILICFASEGGRKVRPQTRHGMRDWGPEGSGATGALGCMGTGGEGGGPARVGGGVLLIGRKSSMQREASPAGSGDAEREDLDDCCCW